MTTTPQTITNLGTGGADLNATNGSTAGADSNDSKFLDWPGDNAGNYIYLPGVASNYLSVPDEAALDVVSDVDIRVLCALDDWTPAALQVLLSKRATGQYSYQFHIAATTGYLTLSWTTDGSTAITVPSTVAPTVADGSPLWVRAALDVDDGGVYKVYFYTSPASDGATWTQLGTTVTGATTTSIFSGTSAAEVGSRAGGQNPAAGKFYRAIVKSGIDGTTVLDVDTSVLTSGVATSFTELSSNAATVTVNRSTSGRKAVAVVSPVHLFGSDDYWEIADNALLDFGASDSFTMLAVVRQWVTQGNDAYLFKKASLNDAATAGYGIWGVNASLTWTGELADGAARKASGARTFVGGSLMSAGITVDRNAQLLTSYLDAVAGTPVDISTLGSLSNASALRVASVSAGGNYADFELIAVAVFRRALSASEIASITTYYQARLS